MYHSEVASIGRLVRNRCRRRIMTTEINCCEDRALDCPDRRSTLKTVALGGVALFAGAGIATPAGAQCPPIACVQEGWRWCSKCQGMFYGLATPAQGGLGHCPAGGAHNYHRQRLLLPADRRICRQRSAGRMELVRQMHGVLLIRPPAPEWAHVRRGRTTSMQVAPRMPLSWAAMGRVSRAVGAGATSPWAFTA